MSTSEDRLTEIVSVRFTASEVERLRLLTEGRPLSHLVRELCLAAARSTRPSVKATAQTSHQANLLTMDVNTMDWSAPEMPTTARIVAGPGVSDH